MFLCLTIFTISDIIIDFIDKVEESIKISKESNLENEYYIKGYAKLNKINLLEKILKTQFEMESSLKEFLKEFKFNFSGDLNIFSNLYNYKELNFKYNL